MGDWRSQFPILSSTTQTPLKTLVRRYWSINPTESGSLYLYAIFYLMYVYLCAVDISEVVERLTLFRPPAL